MSVAHYLYQNTDVSCQTGTMLILFVLQALQPDPVLSQNGPLVSYGRRWWLIWPSMVYQGIPWYTSRVEGLPPPPGPPGLQASFMKSGPRVVKTG